MSDDKTKNVPDEQLANVTGGVFTDTHIYTERRLVQLAM